MRKFLNSLTVCLLGLTILGQVHAETITLTTTNHVALRGPVTDGSVSQMIAEIFSSQEQELYLYLDSPGGSIIAGQRLMSAMSASGKKFNCIVNFAASMAFVILQHCDTRTITPNGVAMQHVASYGVQGDAPNNVSMLSFLERLVQKLDEAQAKRMKMSYAAFKNLTRNDYWVVGDDALANNTVDALSPVACTSKLAKQTTKIKLQSLFGPSTISISKCPLVNIELASEASEIKKLNLIRLGQ
jgi:ATP-dependent protease ClpP protease subunit